MRARLIIPCSLALSLCGLLARPAHAAGTCASDADCAKNWTCEVSSVDAPCAAPACAPGETCEPVECEPVEYKSCRPAPCRADRDCADGMVCYSQTVSNCTDVACAPGAKCPEPSCEPETVSACVPRYLLPCTTASDCGAGFSCEASEECNCSGSSGGGADSDSSSAGGAPTPTPAPDPDGSCSCAPSKELHCRAPHVQCKSEAECSNGWSCAVVGATADCSSSAPSNPGNDASAGAPPVPDCQPSSVIKECVPPYYEEVGNVQGITRDSGGSPTLGATEGSASGTPPKANANGADSGEDASGGCSVAGARTAQGGVAGALLVALGLAFGVRRRRTR